MYNAFLRANINYIIEFRDWISIHIGIVHKGDYINNHLSTS